MSLLVRKRRFFRGVRVVLECQHEAILRSSWWRLSPAIVSVLLGHAVRNGVWCDTCRAMCQPESCKGTCRL